MIFGFNQDWQTSRLPFSLALKNTVNTGVSFDTASHAAANSQRWARAGFQGYGPLIQYPGAGMDGLGCGCGCNGNGGCNGGAGGGLGLSDLICLGAVGLAAYLLTSPREELESYG